MNKLLNFVERKCGETVRNALRNAIMLSWGILSFVMAVAELIFAYEAIIMTAEDIGKGLLFLALDFVAFSVTVFFACLIIEWSEQDG